MKPRVDILIPTFNRPGALAVTLTSLVGQTYRGFRVVISDQTDGWEIAEAGEVKAALRVLQSHGHPIDVHRHLPRRGMAEQRQFLLDQVEASYALFLDDDLILEPFVVEQMLTAIQEERCGFVGSAVIGLSFIDDVRPHEQRIEFWEGRVQPEEILPGSRLWQRYKLHNAANLYHVQQRLKLSPDRTRKYRVAWVGGCVLYNANKLRQVGGFNFWQDLPIRHSGEDVLAQLRVMRTHGGCGLIPSGVYHQELPTTVPDRQVNAPEVLSLHPSSGRMWRIRNIGRPSAAKNTHRQPGNSGD
jgi:glycosyltransferase involved in cell wall biosynthesis